MIQRWCASALTAIALVFCAASPCLATDRYFRDIDETSPDGRLRLTAKSPANSREFTAPFASDFTYTLTDLNTGVVLWQRVQPPDEPSPVQVFLDDSGWVAVRHSDETHSIRAPITGEFVMSFRPLSEFSPAEYRRYVSDTTAGPMWTRGAHWYFLHTDNRWLFVVRPWWGNRVIADIDAGVLLKRNDPTVLAACEAAEVQWARKDLQKDISRVWEGLPLARDRQWRIDTPINILAMARDRESLPILQEVARWNFVNTYGQRANDDNRVGAREYIVNHYTIARIRQMANTAIRLVGDTPDQLPCIWFPPSDEAPTGVIPHEQPDTPREQNVWRVQKGHSLARVVETLGGPDFVDVERREPAAIEYDIDTDDPFTLRITFDDESRVTRTEAIRPPKWKTQEGGTLHPGWSSSR